MSKGYYIGLNDKTTCGGTVLDGDTRIMMYGIAHAKEGDRVTCGKSEGIYQIAGGIVHMTSHGKRMAGTLDSFSTCPCKARLISFGGRVSITIGIKLANQHPDGGITARMIMKEVLAVAPENWGDGVRVHICE